MLVEDLHSDLVDERVRDPCTVVAVFHLAQLIGAHLAHRDLVRLGVLLDWDLRAHPAHGRDFAPVARLDEQPDVRIHEGHLHRHVFAVRQDGGAVGATALDEAEDVIPSVCGGSA